MSEHKHKWTLTMHMDQCHSYVSTYSCECGATASTYDERDTKFDPYSFVWMEQTSNDPCERCQQIIDGAQIVHRHIVTNKDGVDEVNVEELRDQEEYVE